MSTILAFVIEVASTIVVSILLVSYLRPFLYRILTDLCGTEERARFWTVFSNILLIGFPMISALNYSPEATGTSAVFFEVARKLSGNLGGFLLALIGIGLIVSFFALVAPRSGKVQAP